MVSYGRWSDIRAGHVEWAALFFPDTYLIASMGIARGTLLPAITCSVNRSSSRNGSKRINVIAALLHS